MQATDRTSLEATVDAVGDIARAMKGLDPATLPAAVLGALQGMPRLFAMLIAAEDETVNAIDAENEAGQAIADEGTRLAGLLAGVALPAEVRGLVESLPYALA